MIREHIAKPTGMFFAWLTLIFLSTHVYAVDIACEDCGYGQMISAAISHGNGQHRVYSLSTGVIHAFSVTCEGDMVLGMPAHPQAQARDGENASQALTGVGSCPFGQPLKADEVPLSPQMAYAWQLIQQFYVEWDALPKRGEGRDAERIIDVSGFDSRGSTSVFNYLGDYSARTSLHNEVLANYAALQRAAEVAGAAVAAHFAGFPHEIVFTLQFKDGSWVRVTFQPNRETITMIPNSARLPNGEPVVEENSINYTGNYATGGVNTDAYADFLGTRGVNVTGGGVSGRIVCSWDGKTLTCKLPKVPR